MSLPAPLLPDQEFFNIGEACRIVQLPDYTLRYWESKLKLLRPARRSSGHRRYTKRDLEIILRLKSLLDGRHMTLSGARKVLLRELKGGIAESPATPNASATPSERGTVAAKILREIRSELKALLTELG